jgi:hypothetical protein
MTGFESGPRRSANGLDPDGVRWPLAGRRPQSGLVVRFFVPAPEPLGR